MTSPLLHGSCRRSARVRVDEPGFQLRAVGTLPWTRLVTIGFLVVIALLIAVVPIVPQLPDIAAAAFLNAICLALLVTELAMLRRSRDALHASVRRTGSR